MCSLLRQTSFTEHNIFEVYSYCGGISLVLKAEYTPLWASQMAQGERICLPMQKTQETEIQSLGQVGKTPWRRKWQPTPVPLPGEFHGQRSLVGYKEVGHERLSMHAIFHHMHVAQFAHSFCC